jgi:hypothetical protein
MKKFLENHALKIYAFLYVIPQLALCLFVGSMYYSSSITPFKLKWITALVGVFCVLPVTAGLLILPKNNPVFNTTRVACRVTWILSILYVAVCWQILLNGYVFRDFAMVFVGSYLLAMSIHIEKLESAYVARFLGLLALSVGILKADLVIHGGSNWSYFGFSLTFVAFTYGVIKAIKTRQLKNKTNLEWPK